MSYLLNIKAFFFNAKTDYLPYYKKFSVLLPRDANAKAILEAIHTQNESFSYPQLNLVFKINNLVVEEDTLVEKIVSKLGTSLTIDPITSYRSNNGLIINDHDFMQHFELLAPYATASDKTYYKSLYAVHYASETSHFDREYIGDALLVLAYKMIDDGNIHKTAILNTITSAYSGLLDCEYENNFLDAYAYTNEINQLKKMVKNSKNTRVSFLAKFKNHFFKEREKEAVIIDDLENKQVAYYAGMHENQTILEQIHRLEIPMVSFDRMHKLSGATIFENNKTLAFKKAGTVLLEAFDAGAEVIIVEDEASYRMFTEHFTAIENTMGRKMLGLALISSSDFMAQTI